jgi:hypothetical protein
MMRHVVLLRWKEGTTEAEITAVEEALQRMPTVMPFIRRYELGRDLGINSSHDFALIADFDSVEDYRTYAGQGDHARVVSEVIAPILDSMSRVQYSL